MPLWLIIDLRRAGGGTRQCRLVGACNAACCCAPALCTALILALLNPAIEREDREPLTSIVALVVDRQPEPGPFRSAGHNGTESSKPCRTDWKDARQSGTFPQSSTARGRNREGIQEDGTALFDALTQGLSDVPPDRIGGAVMITDGQVHDIPEDAAKLGFNAPLHALDHRTA